MNCPLCLDPVLEERFSNGIEVDICPNCKGIWLDRGELERLMISAANAPTPWQGDGPADRQPAVAATGRNAATDGDWERERSWDRDDDDDDRDRDDDDRDRRKTKSKKKKKKKKKGWGDLLEDVLDDVLDL